jgi:hypothetical protein
MASTASRRRFLRRAAGAAAGATALGAPAIVRAQGAIAMR